MKKKIMMCFRLGGENGGPYVSHQRIMKSRLKQKYCFEALYVPRARVLLTPLGMKHFIEKIKCEKPDAVQVAGLQLEGFLVMYACRRAKVKTILAIHGSIAEAIQMGRIERWLYRQIETYTVKNATAVYGVSEYVGSWPICHITKKFVGTIYNLPGEISKRSAQQEIRKKLGIKQTDFVIASSGRITTEKGYDVLWNAIKALGHRENVKFIIAGDGAYRKQWEKEILEQRFDDAVFLLGYCDNVNEILEESDAFIICTKHETLCISLLEAAMHELPMVATDVGGIPEIIVDGRNGLLVKNGDVIGFADALNRLVQSPEYSRQLGKMAFHDISKKFGAEKITKQLESIYEMVFSAHSS